MNIACVLPFTPWLSTQQRMSHQNINQQMTETKKIDKLSRTISWISPTNPKQILSEQTFLVAGQLAEASLAAAKDGIAPRHIVSPCGCILINLKFIGKPTIEPRLKTIFVVQVLLLRMMKGLLENLMKGKMKIR